MEICTSHFNEDLAWLDNCGFVVNIVHKEGGAPIPNYTYCIPNVGYEVTSYLKYIIERYNTLPDYTAFLHGHETAWHQLGDRPMLDMLRTANIKKHDIIHLNNSYRCCPRDAQFKERPELPEFFIVNCGAQFIVSKNLILYNSKEYYINMFNNTKTQYDAVQLEHTWNYIFTGNYNTVPIDDQFDPPIKEILYSTAGSIPMKCKDIQYCYIGKYPAPPTFIHITTKELYDYYKIRGCLFMLFQGDELAYDLDDKGKVHTIHSKNLHKYIYEYYNEVEKFEQIYFDFFSLKVMN